MYTWIDGIYRKRNGWNYVQQLADIEIRLAGTRGESRAAALVERAFRESSARETTIDEFRLRSWERGKSTLLGSNGETEFSCFALPRSPSGEVSGQLVNLGHGLPSEFDDSDLRGAVVQFASGGEAEGRAIHRVEKYARAVDAGAAGVVYRSTHDGCLAETGSVASDAEPVGSIPAVAVGKETGLRLTRQFEHDRVTLSVDATHSRTTSRNVHATLGPETDEEVLVLAHLDAHDVGEGAIDNGSGVGVLVELADALSAVELDTTVHLVATGAEEVGYRGADVAASATSDSIRAVVNVDSVAVPGALQVLTHGWSSFAAATDEVVGEFGHDVNVSPVQQPFSDHWPFVRRGIPAVAVTCTPPDDRSWGHTAADTLDKLDRRSFVDHAVFVAGLVRAVADADRSFEKQTPSDVAAALEQEGTAKGLKAAGNWPF